MRSHMPHYWRSKKPQSNKFWGANYGFTALYLFSSEVQVILFSFSFIWLSFDFVIKIFLMDKFLDIINVVVVVVWFCCSSWLAFLIMANLINLIRHFLLHWVICFESYLFVHTPIFFWKILDFLGIFYLFLIWTTIMPKLWMSGFGPLCAIARYWGSLFIL